MDFLVNDLSIAGQFHDIGLFRTAVARVMSIRQAIQRGGRNLRCHRGLLSAQVSPNLNMQQAVQRLSNNERRAFMVWLTTQGPHWEDDHQHSDDDWFQVGDNIVTGSAVAEAAVRNIIGVPCSLVSIDPSDWLFSPINTQRVFEDGATEDVAVLNHWTLESIGATLESNPVRIDSWEALMVLVVETNSRLTFGENAFDSLQGHPFSQGAANRIRVLLNTLNALKGAFAEDGELTNDGKRLHADHFVGEKAWFSNSSDSEKQHFAAAMTFRHPERPSETLFCPWHGKVKTPQIRIHFSYPIRAAEPTYVVYVGPKLTKR